MKVRIFIALYCLTFIFATDMKSQKMYKTTWKQSGTIIGSSLAMFGGSLYIEGQRGLIVPSEIASLDRTSIFGLDKSTVGNLSTAAGTASDYLRDGIYVAPLALLFNSQARQNTKEILVMYTELFFLNQGLTSISKSSLGRFRPYTYNPEVSFEIKLQPTTRRSFISGHTSHVASLSFFTATLFDDFYPESRVKYAVWSGAMIIPALTGYLRVKAGKHFPTDVMTGYAVGALVGYFIPKLHKITNDTDWTVFASTGGLGLSYNF